LNQEQRTQLEDALGYTFTNPGLLRTALTHRSHSHEQDRGKEDDYERLEFLGDALLGFVVAEWLFADDPVHAEGVLSRRRQSVVRESTLAEISQRLGLGQAMRLGRGEELSGGRAKPALLADLFEAVLAAVYLDGGIEPARGFVLGHLGPKLNEVRQQQETVGDYKTKLQEQLQSRLQRAPRYRIVSTSGPAHALEFEVEVLMDDEVLARGSGKNRKQAEQVAARAAFRRLGRS
jgi:ribonuclease-3